MTAIGKPIMDRSARAAGSPLGRPKPRDFAISPLLVFYEVTQACDLVCTHCRACAQPSSHPEELSTEQSLRLIEQLAEFPTPPTLVLTGGDPLKRRDVYELIEHAAWFGLPVAITPSATPLVTAAAVKRLRQAGVSRLAISIDGADAATHDATRGVAGSFDRSLQILAEARAAGISTQVNTTLTPEVLPQIEPLADLLATQSIDMWSVFFLVPVGRAVQARRLTAEECEAAFEQLWSQSKRQPYAIKTTEAPHYRRFTIQHRNPSFPLSSESSPPFTSLNVNDGKGVMFISHRGAIRPSGFLPITCGAFPAEHVVRVYQQSPVFRALRDPDQLECKCRRCEFRKVCGGSRARAYAVSGNPLAEEPDCAYVPRTHEVD
jgi:radical SAM protein with 4Fe4S-binding SPASM domain